MHFASDEEITTAVNEFLRETTGKYYDERIKKLVARLQKCIKRNGDYVKK